MKNPHFSFGQYPGILSFHKMYAIPVVIMSFKLLVDLLLTYMYHGVVYTYLL